MRKALLIAAMLAMLFTPVFAQAQTTRPALAQLDAEMRALYADVAAGTVRVRLPVPTVARLTGPGEHPMGKWAQDIDASIWSKLEELAATQPLDVRPHPRPSESVAQARDFPSVTLVPGQSQTVTYLDDLDDSRMVAVLPREAGHDFVGLILNDAGYVAIPTYVTKEEVGERPLRVTAGREQVEASFIGSDRQTNVTVVKLAKPLGKALPLADAKPEQGSLVLMFSPARAGAKLTLWTGGQEDNAVVVNAVTGAVAGFARPGQMLAGGALKSVADQLIEHGRVKRAQLGVMIAQVRPNDPIRQQVALLGARPAVRVAKVLPNTAAEAAGLKVNDIIMSLAGQAVEDLPTFAAAIASRNGPTELKVLRDGKETSVMVNLELK